jgi:hypothetical protein
MNNKFVADGFRRFLRGKKTATFDIRINRKEIRQGTRRCESGSKITNSGANGAGFFASTKPQTVAGNFVVKSICFDAQQGRV